MSSSSGPRAVGTDGSDFGHRQKVASQYQISSLNKARLKFCIFLHFLLSIVMVLKVLQDILDRLDIFILELEELEIPKPMTWEWIWLSSVSTSFVGLSGIRKNRISSIQLYFTGVLALSLCPTLYAVILWFPEFIEYIRNGVSDEIEDWLGYPLAALWFIFLAVCLQIHLFSLYFSYNLFNAWKIGGRKKAS